jgi:transposase-like protein
MITHRKSSAEEKFRTVMEGLQPDANVAAICRHYGVAPLCSASGRRRAWRT